MMLLETAARVIANAERVVVLTGAGISEESGVPVYRQVISNGSSSLESSNPKPGLWNGIHGAINALIFGTKIGWLLSPRQAWELYTERLLRPIAMAEPNPAHFALVSLEQILKQNRTCKLPSNSVVLPIITQNVDGLHGIAGSSSVFEIHGTVREHRCTWGGSPVEFNLDHSIKSNCIPECASSQCLFGAVRPSVVFFAEVYFQEARSHVTNLGPKDALIVVGTSCRVQPVASLPTLALEKGATVIEINPSPSISREITYAMDDGNGNPTASYTYWAHESQLLQLQGKAGSVLPLLVEHVLNVHSSV